MNKKFAVFIGSTVLFSLLGGCTTDEHTKNLVTESVIKNVKKGMSREQVMQRAGKPSSEVSMTHAKGVCQTYIRQRDDKMDTYFVALNEGGNVINSGYQTCAEFDTDPQIVR